jgi:hypothetical protein
MLAIILYIAGIRRTGNPIIAGCVTGQVLAIVLCVTGVCRAVNTVVTGRVTGCILTATTNTGIRGTADAIITVGSI